MKILHHDYFKKKKEPRIQYFVVIPELVCKARQPVFTKQYPVVIEARELPCKSRGVCFLYYDKYSSELETIVLSYKVEIIRTLSSSTLECSALQKSKQLPHIHQSLEKLFE